MQAPRTAPSRACVVAPLRCGHPLPLHGELVHRRAHHTRAFIVRTSPPPALPFSCCCRTVSIDIRGATDKQLVSDIKGNLLVVMNLHSRLDWLFAWVIELRYGWGASKVISKIPTSRSHVMVVCLVIPTLLFSHPHPHPHPPTHPPTHTHARARALLITCSSIPPSLPRAHALLSLAHSPTRLAHMHNGAINKIWLQPRCHSLRIHSCSISRSRPTATHPHLVRVHHTSCPTLRWSWSKIPGGTFQGLVGRCNS
jgi:hypothetical protein